MKMTEENKKPTIQEALQDPSLAHLHGALHHALNTTFKEAFPKKHEMSLSDGALDKVVKLFIENPYMPIKNVLTTIFEQLPNDISAPLLLEITKKTVEKWKSLSATTQTKTPLMATA